jgi:hypothetical protein
MRPGGAIREWLGRTLCNTLCFLAALLPRSDDDPSGWRNPRS